MPPFFMAHLAKLPTYFVKGVERVAAYYTVDATELRAAGYVEEDGERAQEMPAPGPLPEIVVEAGVDAFDFDSEKVEDPADMKEVLEAMTKAELLEFAMENGYDLKNNLPKAQILEACYEILKD